jgi:ketosteroid isomerase-like protein
MKIPVCITRLMTLILFLLLFHPGYSQNSEAEVLKNMNQDWLNSILNRDTATLGKILADDFVMITPFGTRNSKIDNLETLLSKNVTVTSIHIDSLDVQILSADVGVVTAWTSFVIRDGSKETRGKNSYQDVYVRRRGKWVAVTAHVTLISMQ